MNRFFSSLLGAVKDLLLSKKVLTLIIGMIVTWGGKHGIVLDPSMVDRIVVLFAGLLLAQGASDWGKGAAQIQAANPPPPESVQAQTVNVAPVGKK